MRYGRVGFLFTLVAIVVFGVSVYDLSRFAETRYHQLTSAYQQIERLRAANASHLADRETAERARERSDAQVAHASEELERLKIVVATARSPTQERDLELDLAAANEEIERLKTDARTAAGLVTALAKERARAEALTQELAVVRNSTEQLKAEAAGYAGGAVALEQERQRADNFARELASVRQELEQLKLRSAATVGARDRNLKSARQELQSSTRPSNVRRLDAASATNLARVSSAQGRQPGAEPPKPKNQDLPQELRPVW